jgi:hypothetical protein
MSYQLLKDYSSVQEQKTKEYIQQQVKLGKMFKFALMQIQ